MPLHTPWLLPRLERDAGQPNNRFALLGSVYWMRALSILTSDSGDFERGTLRRHYSGISRRSVNECSDTLAYENLLLSLHQVSALNTFDASPKKYDVVRSAVIAWYYAIYFGSSAMIEASSGSAPETHGATIKRWSADFGGRGILLRPFDVHIDTLVKADTDAQIQCMRGAGAPHLRTEPTTPVEAWGWHCGYLNGSAKYERDRMEPKIKGRSDFKDLGVTSFRSSAAKAIRDRELAKGRLNFLSLAFRFRGKANYRDSAYLSYGDDYTSVLGTFIEDMNLVANRYFRMAAHYVSRRVEGGTWSKFSTDLNRYARFSFDRDLLSL